MNDDEIHLYDIRTNEEWKRLGAVAENRPTITINPAEVPERFRHLIPYVERWAIGCDVTRGDYMDKQPQPDIDDFYQTILPFHDALNQWIDDASPQTDAKTYFIIMLAAHCEACPPPSPEEIAEMHRKRAEEREAKRQYWREIARKSLNDSNG